MVGEGPASIIRRAVLKPPQLGRDFEQRKSLSFSPEKREKERNCLFHLEIRWPPLITAGAVIIARGRQIILGHEVWYRKPNILVLERLPGKNDVEISEKVAGPINESQLVPDVARAWKVPATLYTCWGIINSHDNDIFSSHIHSRPGRWNAVAFPTSPNSFDLLLGIRQKAFFIIS